MEFNAGSWWCNC